MSVNHNRGNNEPDTELPYNTCKQSNLDHISGTI